MNINVSVENINLDDYIDTHIDEDGDRVPGGTLRDAIVRQLVDKYSRSDTWKGIAERVQAIRDDEIRAQLAPVVAEALNGPIDRTNSYGEKTGQTTTLREIIAAEARRYLNEPSERYNTDRTSRLQVEVRKAVAAAFKDEVAGAVQEVRDAVSAAVGGNFTEMVSAAVSQALAKR